MKTAISLPDDLFAEGELYAKAHKLSRSELYSRALREYLWLHDPDSITLRLNAIDWNDPEILAEMRDLANVGLEELRRVEW